MSQLFERKVSVVVDTLRVDNLRVEFKVKKSLKIEPNTLDLTITNLSEKSRALVQKKYANVRVAAGYATTVAQIFSGDVRTAESTHEGADWNTRIQAGDGEEKYCHARVQESFSCGAKLSAILTRIAAAMGVGEGNIRRALKGRKFRGGLESFASGYSASGKAATVMTKLLQAGGMTWSIQDGQLQLLAEYETLPGEAILLSADTGLVGSPELGTPKKKTGASLLKVKALLQPGIVPGARIEVASSGGLRGQYRVEKVEHTGDTAGQAWYSEIEAVSADKIPSSVVKKRGHAEPLEEAIEAAIE